MSIKVVTYIELLKICLSDNPQVSDYLVTLCNSHIDWIELLDFAARQGVIGVYWHGIEKLFNSPTSINKPTDDEVMEWWGEIQEIKKKNEDLFKKAAFVSKTLRKEGFENCIIKGPANAIMYPDPYLRMTGDLDVWIKGSKKEIDSYVNKFFPKEKGSKLHIHFPIFKDTLVEFHYTPRILDNPFANSFIQHFFREQQPLQMENGITLPNGKRITAPTPDFNVIFQLTHLMRHFICEGIVLKQLVDYYYVLKEYKHWTNNSSSPHNTTDIYTILKKIKMLKFAGILMYIMKEGLGLEEKYLIVQPNEKKGKFILESIIDDNASPIALKPHSMLSFKQFTSLTERFRQKLIRTLRLIPYSPEETLWSLFYRTKKNIRLD